MITRTIEMHDVNVVAMENGKPILYTYNGFVGDVSKPNKVLKKLQEADNNIIAIADVGRAYTKRYGMEEDLFLKMAKCLDD